MRAPAVKPIMIAAGGTGGHFFPAEALATELVSRNQRIALMTDARAAAKLPDVFASGEVFMLRGAGVSGRGLWRGALALGALGMGTLAARVLLGKMEPAAIVGFGGYPTVAPVTATRFMRERPPVILHEQNAVLGRANRAMASRAAVLALSFPDTARLPAGVATALTGNPVRANFVAQAHVPHDTLNVLVLGGSLGARVFSDAVPGALASLPDGLRSRLRVVQQCRAEDLQRVTAAYAASSIPAELSPFFADVPARMGWADLVIARAGASTIAELTASGRPALLVPLPGAIDDHQTANAHALVAVSGAWLIPQPQIATLGARLATLLADPAALLAAGEAAAAIARRDAASRLADLVMNHARVSA